MRIARLTIAALAISAVILASASAAELTRDEYKAQVEPICKTNKKASDRYLTGVRDLVRRDKLAKASKNFAKAADALDKARTQLAAVPQPPADEARLTRWLSGIKGEVALMRTISRKLAQGDTGKAGRLSVRLQHNASATNNLVVPFAFNYCKIDPAKYS
jgi:hypothetical protein